VKADPVFVRHAIEEGVKLKAFTNPVTVLTGADGCVTGLGCRYLDYRMDTKGRMVLVEDETAEFILPADTLITAAGWESNTLFLRDINGLEFNADGSLRTKSELAETSLRGVFAAGGVIEPEMSLTDAMLSGTRAAAEIDKYLSL
jgi:glutamate synthase (NADPH/NADH) small chain